MKLPGRKQNKAFSIIELLVVLAVIGVFVGIAYPNISNWIADRNVKKEAYEVITYLKERKNEVQTGQYGMAQVTMNSRIFTAKMSNENFIKEYKSIDKNSSYKTNKKCGYYQPNGFIPDESLKFDLGSRNNGSNVWTYPNGSVFGGLEAYSAICITKDGSITFDRGNLNEPDKKTNQSVDYFLLCSKTNSTARECKIGAKFDHMYKITWDRFVNTKLYKYRKNKNDWMLIDG